ncbi:FkbM family methyltransferase [Puniceicoccaceae bacterium K14]|nr:FkbM family methyltransferase [Puniceicoccaceae bacterium K14]
MNTSPRRFISQRITNFLNPVRILSKSKTTNLLNVTTLSINAPKVSKWKSYHKLFSIGALKRHKESILPFLERSHGTYVEVGAHDGGKGSLSLYFEKALGWQGLLIEPWPHLFHSCRKRRKNCKILNVAAVDKSLEDSYIGIEGLPPEKSIREELKRAAQERLEKECKQQVVKLGQAGSKTKMSFINTDCISRILDKAEFDSDFDLLILNLKGYENRALEGFDFNRFKPTFILAHINVGTLTIPNLPVYYERITSSRHDKESVMILFRFADFGVN